MKKVRIWLFGAVLFASFSSVTKIDREMSDVNVYKTEEKKSKKEKPKAEKPKTEKPRVERSREKRKHLRKTIKPFVFYSDDGTQAFQIRLAKGWKADNDPEELSELANASLSFNERSLMYIMVSDAQDYKDFNTFGEIDEKLQSGDWESITLNNFKGIKSIEETVEDGVKVKLAHYKLDMKSYFIEATMGTLVSEFDERVTSVEQMLKTLSFELTDEDELRL